MKIAVLPLIWAACAQAQTGPSFEVASIKPAAPLSDARSGTRPRIGARGGPGTSDPGLFTCTYCNLWTLALQAYDLPPYRIIGQLSRDHMMDVERFDITAKIPEGTSKEQFRLMLQNLLVERFQLKSHREQKQVTGYEMTLGKGGPKMRVSDPNAPKQTGPPPPVKFSADGVPAMASGYGTRMMFTLGSGSPMTRLHAEQETMDQLADTIARSVNSPVANLTGLTEKYDFELVWSSEDGPVLTPPAPPPASALQLENAPVRESAPTIFMAVQSQLGLKLEKKFVATEFLVIDHVEKVPTEN